MGVDGGRFTQQANIPGPATNCGPKYVTGIPCGARDAKQPWRAPGTSPVYSPCGAFCYNDDGGAFDPACHFYLYRNVHDFENDLASTAPL